jgi:hypothetical protein
MTELINELIEDKVYELNFGKSFQNASKLSYHQFKCKIKLTHKKHNPTIFLQF